MNEQLILDIRTQADPILEKLANRSTREFQLGDLVIDEGISLRGLPLSGKALTNVLKILRVRPNFTDLSHKMKPDDWHAVSAKLKASEADTKMFAKMSVDDEGEQTIIDTYNFNNKKKTVDNGEAVVYVDWITAALANSEKEYALKSFHFDSKREMFVMTLLDQGAQVDVLGTGSDLWKMGDRFTFGGLQFTWAPFMERLVCSNGNTANQYGFGSNISQVKYNNRRIQNVIENALKFQNENLPGMLQQAVNHLKTNNISMQEFYDYRQFFERRNTDGQYDRVIFDYFNDEPFFKSYGINISEKSRKWKSTANTGINAYDFFNTLTYLASHPEKVNVGHTERTDLQINASNLLFKRELDLEDVAAPVKVNYPRHAYMN